jgi:hypothetical protein
VIAHVRSLDLSEAEDFLVKLAALFQVVDLEGDMDDAGHRTSAIQMAFP